jgi:hypothetical protein
VCDEGRSAVLPRKCATVLSHVLQGGLSFVLYADDDNAYEALNSTGPMASSGAWPFLSWRRMVGKAKGQANLQLGERCVASEIRLGDRRLNPDLVDFHQHGKPMAAPDMLHPERRRKRRSHLWGVV